MGEAWSAGPNRPPDSDRKGRPYMSFAGSKKSIPVSGEIASL